MKKISFSTSSDLFVVCSGGSEKNKDKPLSDVVVLKCLFACVWVCARPEPGGE